ncbi:hypothetical protein BPORC_1881 [Bifidobacterium porcinum]|nr:hypothetical protein BPORC_1881 [Bifidobacterium porcinum]
MQVFSSDQIRFRSPIPESALPNPPRNESSAPEPDAAYLDTPARHAQKPQSGSELFHTCRYATYLVALRVAYRFYH